LIGSLRGWHKDKDVAPTAMMITRLMMIMSVSFMIVCSSLLITAA
jgi:hypothetical protein